MEAPSSARLTALRALLLAPLLILFIGGVLEALSSPFNFRTAQAEGEVPYWVISISPFIVAAPALLVGAAGIREILRTSRYYFHVSLLPLVAGLLPILIFAALEFRLAQRDSVDAFSYAGSAFTLV